MGAAEPETIPPRRVCSVVREESESVEQEGVGGRDGGGGAAPAMRRPSSAASKSPDRDMTHPQHRRPPPGQSPPRSIDSILGSSPPPIGTSTPTAPATKVEQKPGALIGEMLEDDEDDQGESGEIY